MKLIIWTRNPAHFKALTVHFDFSLNDENHQLFLTHNVLVEDKNTCWFYLYNNL